MTEDLLVRIVRRAPMLEALRGGALDRRDLEDALGVSKPTVHRAAKSLMELGLVERPRGAFELTAAGADVADAVVDFETTTNAALRLAPLLATVETDAFEVDVDLFADAVVTLPDPGHPYRPVDRFMELVRETDSLRGFDSTTIAPANVEDVYRAIVDGMETELIYPPSVVESIVASNPQRGSKAVESGNLTLLVHDSVPCGLAIFDDRVGLGGYDPETGMLRAFVDTDAPAARSWAENVYASFRAEADPLVGV